ncbi:MAG: hypothetical protein ACOY3X_11055 [Pseudomonadota bacterium]
MWEEDEEAEDGAEEEKALEDGLDEEEAEVIENKAAAKKHEEEIDPASLTVSAKEAARRKLEADMEAFLKRGGNVVQVAADESKWERETARAPDEDSDE